MTPYRDRLNAGLYANPEQQGELTVDELKDQLRALDLPVSGNKAELRERLAEAAEE